MKSFRIFALAMVLVLVLTSVVSANHVPGFPLVGHTGSVSAVDSRAPDFTIQKVEVDGTVLSAGSALYVERNSIVNVDVWVRGNDVFKQCTDNRGKSCYNVKVKAFIGGYEYGEVEDVSAPFQVLQGAVRPIHLTLKIPSDIEASDDYTLRVEVFDDDQSTDDSLATKKSYILRLEEIRHSVNIFDTLFNPSNYVQAGQPVFVTVRAENLGDNIEDSVKVTVSVPQLGIQTQEYIDQLETSQSQRNSDRNDGFTSNDLVLMVPQDAKEGTYDVIVRLDYNRFHSFEEQKYTLHVRASQVAIQPSTVVSVDTLAQKVEAGKGAVYKLSVANLDKVAQSYTVEVTGTDGWANVVVTPMTLTVQPDSTSEVNVYVAPNEGFTGSKAFSVKVKTGNNVVTEKNLSLEVTPKAVASDTTKRVLTIVFVVLLLVLVLLAVILLIKKLTEDKDDKGVEGKTYY
ncbi:MAG: hypothetical protein AABX19_04035 [Nanoarchaeota archaeon]